MRHYATGSAGSPASSPAESTTGSPAESALRARAEEVLRALVGRSDARLREDQWQAVEALVVGRRRVLVVQRTGWGKSAVYFVATALLREGWAGWRPGAAPPGAPRHAPAAGATILVSPLLALMRDQVAAAQRAGIRAATISSANTTAWQEVETQVRAGEVDVLLVSPERLNNPAFRDDVLPHLAATTGLVVIDEAHCISDWGHDFRPDYRRIRSLLARLAPGTPVLATTATANARVTADVAEQLGQQPGQARPPRQPPRGNPSHSEPEQGPAAQPADQDASQVLVLRGSLERGSLHLGVRRLSGSAARLAWLTGYLHQCTGSGIVYCLTVSAVTEVTDHLRRAGLDVAAYTGRTEPAERERLEEDLRANRVRALVATSALGMGFDKPDLAFVVHVGAPSSPVSYYQQVGRAGRGVERAEVVLLPGAEDRAIWEWFSTQTFPAQDDVRQVLDHLDEQRRSGGGPLSTAALETVASVRRTRLELMLKVLDVDGAVRRVRGGWESTGQAWYYDAQRYARVAAARADEQRAMESYEALGDGPRSSRGGGKDGAREAGGGSGHPAAGTGTPACRMAFLREVLDDPELVQGWRCGACDLCGGLVLPGVPDRDAVEAARQSLEGAGVELTARRQWPAGMERLGHPGLSGRISVQEQAGTGLAVGRLDGLGISGALRQLFEPLPVRPESGEQAGPGQEASGGQGTEGPQRARSDREARAGRDGEVPLALRAAVLEVADRLEATAATAPARPVPGPGEQEEPEEPDESQDPEGLGAKGPGRRPRSPASVDTVDSVVVVDSRSRPRLVRHLGHAVAHHLGCRALGVVTVQGPAGRHDVNSATRLSQVAASLSIAGWEPQRLQALRGARVVLVDDLTDSGWTLTVAAAMLRRAGAAAVHPLVLAQR